MKALLSKATTFILISIFVLTKGEAFLFAQEATSTPAVNTPAAEQVDPRQDIQAKIDSKNKEIASLEQDIVIYKEQISLAGKQKNTLKNQLNQLALTRKKLTADISLTERRIEATNLSIQALSRDIRSKEDSIAVEQAGIRSLLVESREQGDVSTIELMLQDTSAGFSWNTLDRRNQLQSKIQDHIEKLSAMKQDLTVTKGETEKKQAELKSLRSQLADQRAIVDYNKKQNDSLLAQTKNRESDYKILLADREKKRAAFELELLQFESQLKLITDLGSIPSIGKLLSNPLDKMIITQQFGDTAFARAHTGVYNGKGHNGTDFAASVGTPIKSAGDGVVVATGNTDTVCPGASYGKWVLVKHPSIGLSTLYAHLSIIKATEGSSVSTGDVIGYSGNTGYTTGPHLHFTVYATQGVEVTTRKSVSCGGTYRMPIADLKAYLNPMLYL